MLRDWTIRLAVDVIDPGGAVMEGVLSGFAIEDGAGFNQPGFPPLEAWYLVESPSPGDVILTGGPHPAGYRKQNFHSRSSTRIDRDEYRRDYLLLMAGIPSPEAATMSARWARRHIEWTGEAAYRSEAAEVLRRMSEDLRRVKAGLVDRRLLSAAEAAAIDPQLVVHAADRRSITKPPLPALPWSLPGR